MADHSGLKRWVPLPLRKVLRAAGRARRRIAIRRAKVIDTNGLERDLKSLGIAAGDVLIVHTALSRIGFVAGGAETVVRALLDVLGDQGTLVMPSFPFDTYVAEYLRTEPRFHVTETPSRMGKVTEVFRLHPGVVRSIHPTHPVVALGPQAAYLTQDHVRSRSTFDGKSPFFRLCELHGKILLLGVDFHAMTNLHVVEDAMADFPYRVYAPDEHRVTVVGSDGAEQTMLVRAHNMRLSALRDCNKMEPYFLEAGVLRLGKVGEAEARLMDAAGVLDTMENLAHRGITMYRDGDVPEDLRTPPMRGR